MNIIPNLFKILFNIIDWKILKNLCVTYYISLIYFKKIVKIDMWNSFEIDFFTI